MIRLSGFQLPQQRPGFEQLPSRSRSTECCPLKPSSGTLRCLQSPRVDRSALPVRPCLYSDIHNLTSCGLVSHLDLTTIFASAHFRPCSRWICQLANRRLSGPGSITALRVFSKMHLSAGRVMPTYGGKWEIASLDGHLRPLRCGPRRNAIGVWVWQTQCGRQTR
jgi:hypothetical protein